MSSLEKSTFISAEVTLFFAIYWRVRPVLMYFRKPILASRLVENLLNVSQVLRDCRVGIMLCLLYLKAEFLIFE